MLDSYYLRVANWTRLVFWLVAIRIVRNGRLKSLMSIQIKVSCFLQSVINERWRKLMKIKILLAMTLSLIVMSVSAVPVGHVGRVIDDGDDYLASYSGVVMQVVTTYINGLPRQMLSRRTVTAATLSGCQHYSMLYASGGGYIVSSCRRD